MRSLIRNICAILIAPIALSCVRLDIPEPTCTRNHDYPVLVNVVSDAASRISVNGTSLAWQEDDKLEMAALTADTLAVAELSVYSIDTSDPRKASFAGFVSMLDEPETCIFTFPSGNATEVDTTGLIRMYFNNQTGTHRPFMYAKTAYDSDGISGVMRHAGAVLEIDVSDALKNAGVSKLAFCGLGLESLSPVIINPDNGSVSFTSEAGTQITVSVQKTGKTYIAVPPINLPKGFSIICSNSDGTKNMIRTFSSEGTMTSGYDFSNRRGQIIPITLDGTFENYSLKCSKPEYVHTIKDNLLNGTAVSFSMTGQGASSKVFEEWGAKLFQLQGRDTVLFRSVSYRNVDKKLGEKVTMSVNNNWDLLPGGTYIFAPYYKIYGSTVSLDTEVLNISDPKVNITLSGSTSYDKYTDGRSDTDPNTHTSTLIEGVQAIINVHPDILDEFKATVAGDGTTANPDKTMAGQSSTLNFGNLTRTKWHVYEMTASAKVGAWNIPSVRREFRITGLPYEADFTQSNPKNWAYSWSFIGSIEYSDSRVKYLPGSWGGEAQGAVKSPAFNVPDSRNIGVKMTIDACSANTSESVRYMYYSACEADASAVYIGNNSLTARYAVSYSKDNYIDSWSNTIVLSAEEPSLMLSSKSKNFNKALFQIKINYAE